MEEKMKSYREYPYITERSGVWKEITKYISRNLGKIDSILEIGSGYCDFINNYPAEMKVCFELNPERKMYANPSVDFRCGDVMNLIKKFNSKVDVIFASNFLEHLSDKQLSELMPMVYNTLKENGRLVLLQPNYRLCSQNYFDDETHQTVFSDENITQFLKQYNFDNINVIPGLLPFSMKSKLPKWPFLVRLYLNSPIRPKAAQMYVVAKKVKHVE